MRALAQSLNSFVEAHFKAALARDSSSLIRPVVVGPPIEALREMFSNLTGGGQGEWQLQLGSANREVIVLLIDSRAPPSGTGISRGCHWDYAVTVRNSRPLVLTLAARASWDNRPESLANTTETLGDIAVGARGAAGLLQGHLVRAVAAQLGLPETQARELLSLLRAESATLEPASSDTLVWQLLQNLLVAVPGNSPADAACSAVGLPLIANSGKRFTDAYDLLLSLGEFVGTAGLRDAIDQMKATTAAATHGVSASLDSLQQHLATRLPSPTAFQSAPAYHYRVTTPVPAWYNAINANVLADILSELDQGPRQDRLALSCTNGIDGLNPLRGGPFIVGSAPELRATSQATVQPAQVAFTRKVDRTPPVGLTPLPNDPFRCTDTSPLTHRRPIKYKVDANNFRPGVVDVLVLDTFACGGLVVARGAERTGTPVFAPRTNSWTQELTLARGGATELQVFHGSQAAQITLARAGEAPVVNPTQAGARAVTFTLDLEDNDALAVGIADAAGNELGTWTVQVAIRDMADVSGSRLEALIRQHRTRRTSVPHAPDTLLHRLELGSYLPFQESWRPVTACWASRISSRLSIDWTNPSLGDVKPQIDPRPTINPPAPLLAAREAVRVLLNAEQRCVSEIEVDSPALTPLIEVYLRLYLDWLTAEPSAACWFDVVTIHGADWNAQAGRYVATDEPVVALLSPLHPLRLGWHAIAQRQLSESLQHPCPAAGLLSPTQSPDAGALYLFDGHSTRPRSFFSLPAEHPHWAVLINTTFLDRPALRTAAMQQLAELGLSVQGIVGGFTSQQTQDSLAEVNRLLPARATLRVGIVGDADSSSECGTGVFRWTERQHSQDSSDPTGCLQVEVFDTRGAADPSPEQLAGLSETTGERVRWFKLSSGADVPRLDLSIIDQLGTRTPEATHADTRSAVTPGCLFRIRLREDFHNARAIVESRVASASVNGSQLAGLVTEAIQAYEQLSAADANHTHFRFTPNQDAVGSRLRNAIFLSVTSSQVDPACIVRGTVSHGGYLWDYELPGVFGGGESSLGYYLVAQPTPAMCDSVERAAALVATPPPSVPALLEEISRHGIPILKRLASGGSQSRGELGLLLAARFLQDAFRPGATTPHLPVWTGTCIHLVLPVDPYEDLFERLRQGLHSKPGSSQRPDLVVAAIQLRGDGQPIAIKITPVEVKYRATGMAAGDMGAALGQASNLGKLLADVWTNTLPSDLWNTCSSALLAQFLDFGFRIYAASWLHGREHADWAAAHERVMRDVLARTAQIVVNQAGRLIVFDGSTTTRIADLDGDGRQDTVAVSQADSRALLVGNGGLSIPAASAIQQLDFSFPDCGPTPAIGTPRRPSPSTPADTIAAADGAQDVSTSHQVASEPATQEPPAEQGAPIPTGDDAATVPSRAASSSRVPVAARQQVRDAFAGFIANEPAVARLTNDLLRALIEQPPHLAKNYLFTGLPSTGKTELARRMADALALPFIKLDGRSVSNRGKLFDLINGELRTNGLTASQIGQQVGLPILEYPPLIVFIDEVHLVPRSVQEALLTMLEADDRTVVLTSHVAHMHRATFLFATTRVSDVDAAFVSRCDEIQLREYNETEVAQILRWKVPQETWPESVYQELARFGRCVPRIAIQLAEALETALLVSEEEKPVASHLDDVRRAREIDAQGLTRMDFEYLGILERAGRPVGEQNLLNLMRTVDKDRIVNEVEPFLVRLRFIKHGPGGRELTPEGRDYLLAHRLREQGRA